MREATLIFPNQLFRPHPASAKHRLHLLVEHERFFGDSHASVRYHKQKLMLHRASMKKFARELEDQGVHCEYIEYGDSAGLFDVLMRHKQAGLESLHLIDPTDCHLEESLKQFAEAHGLALLLYQTPHFLMSRADIDRYFETVDRPSFSHFYEHQRRKMGILVDKRSRPIGGRWMFETPSLRIAHDDTVPRVRRLRANTYVDEARRYVEATFPDHPGMTSEFVYPIDDKEARAWLDHFLEHRFSLYHAHRNDIPAEHLHTFCSMLSAVLNDGLLTPAFALERVNEYILRHRIPLESIELLVRGIIGRREYARAIYIRMGEKLRSTNFFFHARRPSAMWYGTSTGLLPLDRTLEKIARYAYCSASERLMVLGNIMLLCEIHPDEVYRWFMEMLIDGSDWSMVPNVYGMSQYADGGMVAADLHIFPSRRIMEMSSYEPGDWCRVWDGLFWRFVGRHKMLLSRNERFAPLVRKLKALPERKLKELTREAEGFIAKATK